MAVTPDQMSAAHSARGELVLRMRGVRFDYHVSSSGQKKSPSEPSPPASESAVGGVLRKIGWRKMEISALAGIDLDLYAGDRIGIMGTNGAGKSTLLRVMAGIYPPSAGEIETSGRVSAVLGQTHGMDPELTGFENIRIRGLFMGLSKQEILEKTNEIAEYSELGEYLDLPLRVYSPGMRMRLGFSITTCFQPDILLLDEWLSAGDQGFRHKAVKRMQEFVDSARCVVIVSHNRALLEQFCESILIMDNGQITRREQVESRSEDDASDPLSAPL